MIPKLLAPKICYSMNTKMQLQFSFCFYFLKIKMLCETIEKLFEKFVVVVLDMVLDVLCYEVAL